MSDKDELLATLIDRDKPIRFSCSDIAALAGYHPYANFSELFEKYLYQDLDLLKQLDCKKLGIEIISVDQELEGVLTKLNAENQSEFRQIISLLSNEETLQNHAAAQALLHNVAETIKKDSVVKAITKEEIDFLEKELESRVKTQYGIFSEDSALNKYEEITGFKVVERNDAVHYMEIPPLVVDLTEGEDASASDAANGSASSTGGALRPLHVDPTLAPAGQSSSKPVVDATSILMASAARRGDSSALALKRKTPSLSRSTTSQSADDEAANAAKKRKKAKPAFYLIGKVDGISYQLDVSSDDANKWKPTKVVVEVKSRVFQVKDPPPLYEQIQLVAYMTMLNCAHGDLVQAVRLPAADMAEAKGAIEKTTIASSTLTMTTSVSGSDVRSDVTVVNSSSEASVVVSHQQRVLTSSSGPTKPLPNAEFKISRVTLNAAPYFHQFHWETVIIPRLHVFRDAVIAVRKNDDMRVSFLLAEEDTRLALIQHLCPYLTN
eukprot:gene9833-7038_t